MAVYLPSAKYVITKDNKVNKNYEKLLLSIEDGMKIPFKIVDFDVIQPKSSRKLIETIMGLDIKPVLLKEPSEDCKTGILLINLNKKQKERLAELKSQIQ